MFWLLFVYVLTMSFESLNDFVPTSKDCKALMPVLMNFLTDFKKNYEEMFQNMKQEFRTSLSERDAKVASLESEVSSLKNRLSEIEEKIEEGEAYEKRDTLIISGSKVPPVSLNENCLQVTRNIIREHLKISVPENEVSVTHRMGPNVSDPNSNKRTIIVKFCRRNTKNDILTSARKMKVPNLFVNECLTSNQRMIGYALRKARRENPEVVSGSTTFEGKYVVWTKPPNPSAIGARDIKHSVGSVEKLEKFLLRTFNKPLNYYIQNYQQ